MSIHARQKILRYSLETNNRVISPTLQKVEFWVF